MLKKLIPAFAAAVAMLTPVAPAAAWDEVCLHFRGGAKTWFIGQLNVIHGFDADRGMPTTYPHPTGKLDIRGNPKRFRAPFAESSDDSNPADARLLSREVGAGASVCTSIAGLPEGTPFIAYMNTYNQAKRVLCSTHPSNPNKWYLQTNRPYRQIWFHTWGAAWSPRCVYSNESN